MLVFSVVCLYESVHEQLNGFDDEMRAFNGFQTRKDQLNFSLEKDYNLD